MSRPTEVLVNVEDLELVTRNQPTVIDTASPEPWASAWNRLVAAIPPPEWEPTDEQVEAWLLGMGWTDAQHNIGAAKHNLKKVYAAGLRLP